MYTAQSLIKYARDYYAARIEYPWQAHPTFAVVRHEHSDKWFALVITASEYTLGLSDNAEKMLDAVNMKLDPLDVEFLKNQPGFVPAYHMNKTHWITLLLTGTVPDKQIEEMLATSYTLTSK